jgi:hypothetical protein
MAAMNPPTSGGGVESGAAERPSSSGPAPRGGLLAAAAAALVAVAVAAGSVANTSDAAHDAAVARVLGLRAQAWRAIDVVVGNALALAPIGTRSMRAEWGAVLVAAVAAALVATLATSLLAACADAPRTRVAIAAVAASTAAASAPWQLEAGAVGGAVTGAALVLLPLALLDGVLVRERGLRAMDAAVVGGLLGLATGHEPLAGACAVLACAARLASGDERRGLAAAAPAIATGFAAGLAPLVLSLARVRAAGEPLGRSIATAWAGENGGSANGTLTSFCRDEVGLVLGVAAAAGIALAMLVPRARPLALALGAVTAAGIGCAALGAPVGPVRYGAPLLAAFGCACVLAAVAMQAAVRAVTQARLPFARGSAAMILVLEVVLPVETADGTLTRLEARRGAREAAAAWNDLALGTLPPRTVVLLPDARLALRVQAAVLSGAVRADVLPVAIGAGHPLPWGRLADDAALVPLSRDLALAGAPGEASLSGLAAARPVAMIFDPRWGGAVARHLVPQVFFDRFEREPRGASDRRKALETWSPLRELLVQRAAGDPDLPALR